MEMWLPGSGSLIDVAFETGTSPHSSGHAVVQAPSPADVDARLEQLRKGHIEYVILCRDDGWFQQVTGDGDGPYWLERRPSNDTDPYLVASSPIGFELLRQAMHAYLGGGEEPNGLVWAQETPPPPKKGLFKRLLGR